MDMYMRRKCQECRLRKCKEMGMLAECEYHYLPRASLNYLGYKDGRRRTIKTPFGSKEGKECNNPKFLWLASN